MSKKKNKNLNDNKLNATGQDIVVYSKSDYQRDEKIFNNGIKNNKIDWSNFSRLMIHDLCCNTQLLNTGFIGEVRLEDAVTALRCPETNWRILLAVSTELMHYSPHYYRLSNLYSNMAMFCYGIDLYDVKENLNTENLKKAYNSLVSKFENMQLKHEFSKIMKVIPYQDIYCGLVVESPTDFFFQEMNFKMCKLYQIQDGLYNFAINLSMISPKKLNVYPDYVQRAYLNFIERNKNGEKISNWYLPPSDKQICIKLNSQWTYPFPLLIGLVRDILDLDIYKKLNLQSARTDNYKAIMIEVPIDKNTVDKPLLTPDTLGVFAEINRQSMSDDIGLLYTLGSSGEAISFKDSNNTRNNVSDSVNELYNSSGVTKELFNGSSSATAVTYSIENDSGFIYGLYRQFERWCNRFIKLRKFNKISYKFFFYLLDITIFNRDTVIKRYKEGCSIGLNLVDKLLAAYEISPARVFGSYILHQHIFDYQNNFISMSSVYNTSVNTGRPTNAENGELLSDEGEKSADAEKSDV